jgi:hypothetical protein
MHRRDSRLTTDAEERLVAALRALPDAEPPEDGFERLRARLAATTGRGWPTALVAGLVLAITAALLHEQRIATPAPGPSPAVSHATPPDATELPTDWRRRDEALEGALAALPETRLTRASTGLTTALLEDGIAQIDDELSAAAAGRLPPGDADALRRRRLVLLDSLVRVRYTAAADPTP